MKKALKLIDLLDELENIFDEPLYLCDVKADHFGISKFGRAKLLDSDNIGLKSVIGSTILK